MILSINSIMSIRASLLDDEAQLLDEPELGRLVFIKYF
jgi:hypothetical protein